MIMHESQPDPEEPDEHECVDGRCYDSNYGQNSCRRNYFEPPEDDEPDIPENYPPTVAAFFEDAGITQPE